MYSIARGQGVQIRVYHTIEYATTLSTPTIDIHGTLIIPSDVENLRTLAIIVPGIDLVDRYGNKGLMRNSAYYYLANALAQNNIGALCYDKRGVGVSTGDQSQGSYFVELSNYVDDLKGWIEKMRTDDRLDKIVLIGHNEGSLICMLAINQGAKVDAFISIAGKGRKYSEILKERAYDFEPSIKEVTYAMIDSLAKGNYLTSVPWYLNQYSNRSLQGLLISLMKYDPVAQMKRIRIPTLVIQGEYDLATSIKDAKLLSEANERAKLIIVPNMNNIMKDCPTFDPNIQSEFYTNPAIPLSPQLTKSVIGFIKTNANK